ncbi:MAG: ABC transporter permease [Acetobacteraceae bacterium]
MEYALRRTLQLVPTLLGIVTLTFALVHAAPGGPLVALSGEFSTAETKHAIEALYGLDRPVAEQYLLYMGRVLHGDLGVSYVYKQGVLAVILDRLPATLLLMSSALAVSSLLGIGLGLAAAGRPGAAAGQAIRAGMFAAFAVPMFWSAQLLALLFAYGLGWFPVQGMRDIRADSHGLAAVLDLARHLVLPVIAVSLHDLALVTAVTRARVRDEMGQQYYITALAKGLGERVARRRHALRNALLPIVTLIGGRVAALLAGAVLVETVFGWPGLGQLIVAASLNRDYPLVLGLFLCISGLTLLANLVTDLLYPWIDPRIRLGSRAGAG